MDNFASIMSEGGKHNDDEDLQETVSPPTNATESINSTNTKEDGQ